nr:ATP synthase F0 subunit 6 [Puncturella cf. parvinobilis]
MFSSFDDHNAVFMSYYMLPWTVLLLFIANMNMVYWIMPGRWMTLLNMLNNITLSQVLRSFGRNLGSFMNIVAALFIFIILTNMVSLVPYIFSLTSHLTTTFSLGLPFWLSLIISTFSYNFTTAVAKVLPSGAPAALNSFLVLVETISILMRPLTLSIRLTANMSAGHIVLCLIGVYMVSALLTAGPTTIIFLLFIHIGYFVFEVGVSAVQAYIFTLLINLYANEHATDRTH